MRTFSKMKINVFLIVLVKMMVTITSVYGSKCRDLSNKCPSFKRTGMCQRQPARFRKVCPVSCGACGCMDKRSSNACSKLKRYGWCDTKKAVMRKTCAQTCGFCAGSAPAAIVAPQPQQHSTCPYKNNRPHNTCQYFLRKGYCDSDAGVREGCAKTCKCIKGPTCLHTEYGCCADGKTTKSDRRGSNCNAGSGLCMDDNRFKEMCKRFEEQCNVTGALSKSLQTHCRKTCKLC